MNLGIKEHITFLRSFSDDEKLALLDLATCLLYTPSNEHFGIVPIESMFMKCPVIACNSGGPLETVQDEVGLIHYTAHLFVRLWDVEGFREFGCREAKLQS